MHCIPSASVASGEEAPDEETAPAFDTATASPAGADSTAKAEADSTEKAEPETFKFQCPDGRGFNDREAYKVHMVEKILKFDKLVRETKAAVFMRAILLHYGHVRKGIGKCTFSHSSICTHSHITHTTEQYIYSLHT